MVINLPFPSFNGDYTEYLKSFGINVSVVYIVTIHVLDIYKQNTIDDGNLFLSTVQYNGMTTAHWYTRLFLKVVKNLRKIFLHQMEHSLWNYFINLNFGGILASERER